VRRGVQLVSVHTVLTPISKCRYYSPSRRRIDRGARQPKETGMQFYRDGFRGGNRDIKQAAPNRRNRGVNEPLPEKVDVRIAGTGPAGLCLAAQLSQF